MLNKLREEKRVVSEDEIEMFLLKMCCFSLRKRGFEVRLIVDEEDEQKT